MKKEDKIRLCCEKMKERHGKGTIILFHVGNSYEAYFDDAQTITRIMEVPLFRKTEERIPCIRIPDTLIEECKNRLLDAGCAICVSDVRGASGRHILESL